MRKFASRKLFAFILFHATLTVLVWAGKIESLHFLIGAIVNIVVYVVVQGRIDIDEIHTLSVDATGIRLSKGDSVEGDKNDGEE